MGISDINGLKIKGGIFGDTDTTLKFELANKKVCLIYGKNGSGKTTVSRGIYKTAKKDTSNKLDSIAASFIDTSDNIVELSNVDNENIHVFNEDFIFENIHLKSDGLGTLALFGRQDEISKTIDELIARQERIPDDIKAQNNIIQGAEEQQKGIIEEIIKMLKQKGGWAERQKTITGKSSVTKNIAQGLIDMPLPNETYDVIAKRYDMIFAQISDARTGAKIETEIPFDIVPQYSSSEMIELLSEKIMRPVLSEREKTLIDFAQKVNTPSLQEIADNIGDKHTKYCPYCMQEIDSNTRHNIAQLITKLLDDQRVEHIQKLQAFLMPEDNLSHDFSTFDILDKGLYDSFIKAYKALKDQIVMINEFIKRKISDPYTPIIYNMYNFNVNVNDYRRAASTLKALQKRHNQNVEQKERNIETLMMRNKELARIDCNTLVDEYNRVSGNINVAHNEISKLGQEKEDNARRLKELEGEAHNITVAPDVINNYLRYIYHCDNSLKVNRGKQFYSITSGGKEVPPKYISTGERNMLALCYFFASALKCDITKDNTEPELYVIDDPISSFDKERALGIMSLIKFKLTKILDINPNAKFIIMTHNLLNFIEFEKTIEKHRCVTRRLENIGITYSRFQLHNTKLETIATQNKNLYDDMLHTVYDFACGERTDILPYIGNLLRRTTEAFGSFEYKMDFEEFQDADKFVWEDCEKDLSAAIRSAMIRMCLHGGSHTENKIRYDLDTDFVDTLSLDEAIYCAKVVIVMLYILNRKHILVHLCDHNRGQREANLLKWMEEIREHSPLENIENSSEQNSQK